MQQSSTSPPTVADSRPDVDRVASASELVDALGSLRLWAGNPSLRRLRALAGTTTAPTGDTVDRLPTSTTSHVLAGKGLPKAPRLAFVEAYVRACLHARHVPSSTIATELERWRRAWHRVAHDDAPDARPAPPPDDPKVSPPALTRANRRYSFTASGLAALVAAVAVLAGGTSALVARTWLPPATPQSQATTRPSVAPQGRQEALPVHRTGTVTALRDTDGVDLDTGRVAPQSAPGIDVSGWGGGNNLGSQSLNDRYYLLAKGGPERSDRCPAPDDPRWGIELRGLYFLEVGRQVCTVTDQGRPAMLTFDHRPNATEQTLFFHYVVWRPSSGD